MTQQVKVLKRLIWWAIGTAVIIILINLNVEVKFINVNLPIVSNQLFLAIVEGIFTGIVAVIAEKFYVYKLNKREVIEKLYDYLLVLYAEIYYWQCNINELEKDHKISLPKNLFENKRGYLLQLLDSVRWLDYDSFQRNELQKSYREFVKSGIPNIKNMIKDTIYFEIEMIQTEIAKNEGTGYISRIYEVLYILNEKFEICRCKIENVLVIIDRLYNKVDWIGDKEIILSSYIGLYNASVKQFIQSSQIKYSNCKE